MRSFFESAQPRAIRRTRARRFGVPWPAITAWVLASAIWVVAHEGHNLAPQRPVYREAVVGSHTYRVGLAVLPQDALVGEDVRFELQLLRLPDAGAAPAPGTPVGSANIQVRIIPTAAEPHLLPHVGPGEKPGTYTTRYRFADAGQYAIGVQAAAAGDTINTEFPLAVGAGPVFRTTLMLDAVVLLIFGGFAFAQWRHRTIAGAEARRSPASVAAVPAAGIVVLVLAHAAAGPRVGRLFLPERHFGAIAWDMAAPPGGEPPAVAPHVDPPGTPPHSHPKPPGPGPQGSGNPVERRDIASIVVPVPGQLVEVVVPASARVLFDDFTPRVGRTVRRGQKLATLEYNYILHDAVHMINQRWLSLVPMLATRRASLEADVTAARTRYLAQHGDPGVREAMRVLQSVAAAELAATTAKMEYERAQKLLVMNTAEITQSNPVRRPLVSPIDGVLENVNFTHGQLTYENDKLFTILDLTRVWIETRFPADLVSAEPPAHLQFLSPAFPDRPFEGRRARVAQTVDRETGTLSAFYEVVNPGRLLRVGMRVIAQPPSGDALGTRGLSVPAVARAVERADKVTPAPRPATISLAAVIVPKPELTAEVAAPLWGRIEFAGRRLNVGDQVKTGEDLANVILELSVDERYQMNARAVDIAAERDMSVRRKEQADKRWKEAAALAKANPQDAFRKEEAELLEKVYDAALVEENLLTRQVEAYQDVIKRRDPKTTVVKAPISGVITEIGFRPGELNGTDEFRRLFTIVNTSSVWLEAQVFDHQSAAVLTGFRRGSFTAPGLPSSRGVKAPIAISGSVNPDTGALRAIFDVPNPGGLLRIGSSARVVVSRD